MPSSASWSHRPWTFRFDRSKYDDNLKSAADCSMKHFWRLSLALFNGANLGETILK